MGYTAPVGEIAGRIELVQGQLGAGKTTFAAKCCRKVARLYGLGVASNADLGVEGWGLVRSWADMEAFPGHVILLDEVHLTIPADRSLATTAQMREAVSALTMVRKRRQVVFATAQRWSSVSAIYKELATRFVTVRPWVRGRLHVAYDVERKDLRRATENQGRFPLAWYSPRSAEIDTLAEVTPWWSV